MITRNMIHYGRVSFDPDQEYIRKIDSIYTIIEKTDFKRNFILAISHNEIVNARYKEKISTLEKHDSLILNGETSLLKLNTLENNREKWMTNLYIVPKKNFSFLKINFNDDDTYDFWNLKKSKPIFISTEN